MAGDWIKVEHATLDKPEVSLFSELLGVPVDQGVGILVRFWVWVDRNARNGTVTHVTPSVTDNIMHCPGFSAALVTVGWISFDETLRTMTIPNFLRHNETPAKQRSTNAERQARYRLRKRNVTSVTTPLPEKRREEKSSTTTPSLRSGVSDFQSPPPAAKPSKHVNGNGAHRATRLPEDWSLPDDWRDWAVTVYHLDPQRVVRISLTFRDHFLQKPGKDATSLDWKRRWQNWIRKDMNDA